MSGFASQRETKEQVTLTLPSGLARQITDKANAMHMSVDAVAAVLLAYGLESQEEREREIASLHENVLAAPEGGQGVAIEALGEYVFNK
jgi:hypothetical protein